MAADDPHFRLRVSADLKAKVEEAARANNRSMNAEIVARLERSFLDAGESGQHDIAAIAADAAGIASRRMAEFFLKTMKSEEFKTPDAKEALQLLLQSMIEMEFYPPVKK